MKAVTVKAAQGWHAIDLVPVYVWLIEGRCGGFCTAWVIEAKRPEMLWPLMHEVATAFWEEAR